MGSVFSPYYAWALRHRPGTPAEDHCAINVALYSPGASRWAMTERGARQVSRGSREFVVGPSRVHWDGSALALDLDERGMPLPRRVRGRVRLTPRALCGFATALDGPARHRWGPIAPSARIEVEMRDPALRWTGQAYLDSNEGDEPVERGFAAWDWSRASLRDGATAVIYDARTADGASRLLACRFRPDGGHEVIEAPPRQPLPRTRLWRIERGMRSEGSDPVRVLRNLEDTPFYSRQLLHARLCGQSVTAVHESLDVPRLVSLPVRLMLPWRMPRRT